MQYFSIALLIIILSLSVNHHILYSNAEVHNCLWRTSDAQASEELVGNFVHKECPSINTYRAQIGHWLGQMCKSSF